MLSTHPPGVLSIGLQVPQASGDETLEAAHENRCRVDLLIHQLFVDDLLDGFVAWVDGFGRLSCGCPPCGCVYVCVRHGGNQCACAGTVAPPPVMARSRCKQQRCISFRFSEASISKQIWHQPCFASSAWIEARSGFVEQFRSTASAKRKNDVCFCLSVWHVDA